MSNLTQEQIDAMLNGTALPADDDSAAPNGEVDISAYNSSASGQDDAVPAAGSVRTSVTTAEADMERMEQELESLDKSSQYLSPEEIDILGEMGNISMGAAATTMYTLLGRRVTITTPKVFVYTSDEVLSVYNIPFLVVTVEYSKGMEGKNLLILKETDSALITDLLMGGDGNIDFENTELDEMHLSAMNEIMNQMIGASSTSLSTVLGHAIDITPPSAMCVGRDTDISEMLDGSQLVIKVSFDMEIEGLLKSKLMQLMPIEAGKKLAQALLQSMSPQKSEDVRPQAAKAEQAGGGEPAAPAMQPEVKAAAPQERLMQEEAQPVRVKPFSYQAFDEEEAKEAAAANPVIDLISDIPLQVAVELGKTKKSINDILNMGIGSVIVLDKMAGELVEVVVNGKHIARGEVVVIDENYGVRITDIDHAYVN